MSDLVVGAVFLSLVIGAIYSFYEDRITSNLEQILGIKMKRFEGKSIYSYTYEGLSWAILIPMLIFAIVMFYPIAIGAHNFPAYIGILFTFIYPPVVMIIRNGTFSDYSIPSEENPVYVGSDVVTDGPGYNPFYYWLFSFPIGIVSTFWGFYMLNFQSNPVNHGISLILVGLALQTLVLFPDVINRVSPVDLRTKKGIQLMSGVTVAIVIFLIFLGTI